MANRQIYILKCDSYYKVGISATVKKRLKDLQIGNPRPIEIVCLYPLPENKNKEFAEKIESLIHRGFACKHVSGEWFLLSNADIQQIDRVCRAIQTVNKEVALPAIDEFKKYCGLDFNLVAEE